MTRIETLDSRIKHLAEQFVEDAFKAGIDVIVTSARRTIAEQNALYSHGRSKPGQIVTNAKGGSSPHNFGLAFDVVPVKNGVPQWNASNDVWERLGAIGKSLGLKWGGEFKTIVDRPHFELPVWREVQAAWRRGEVQVA